MEDSVLTSKDILMILERLSWVDATKVSPGFPYRIVKQSTGYVDGDVGKLQAKLSIMLEVASARETAAQGE